jgi:hypothetical protein
MSTRNVFLWRLNLPQMKVSDQTKCTQWHDFVLGVLCPSLLHFLFIFSSLVETFSVVREPFPQIVVLTLWISQYILFVFDSLTTASQCVEHLVNVCQNLLAS